MRTSTASVASSAKPALRRLVPKRLSLESMRLNARLQSIRLSSSTKGGTNGVWCKRYAAQTPAYHGRFRGTQRHVDHRPLIGQDTFSPQPKRLPTIEARAVVIHTATTRCAPRARAQRGSGFAEVSSSADRRWISARTTGATCVPRISMARSTLSCGIGPMVSCSKKRSWRKISQ